MPGRREWLRVTCGLQGGKDLYGPITRGTGEIGSAASTTAYRLRALVANSSGRRLAEGCRQMQRPAAWSWVELLVSRLSSLLSHVVL